MTNADTRQFTTSERGRRRRLHGLDGRRPDRARRGRGLAETKEGVTQFFEMFRAAFRLRMGGGRRHRGGDKAGPSTITGTNDSEFMGMPATGKSVDFQAVDIVRVNDEGARRALGLTER